MLGGERVVAIVSGEGKEGRGSQAHQITSRAARSESSHCSVCRTEGEGGGEEEENVAVPISAILVSERSVVFFFLTNSPDARVANARDESKNEPRLLSRSSCTKRTLAFPRKRIPSTASSRWQPRTQDPS